MDDHEKEKPPENENAGQGSERILQLSDGQVGETETDGIETKPKQESELELELVPKSVSFELPGTSWESTLTQRQKLDETKALIKDMIESMLPTDKDMQSNEMNTRQEPTTTTTAATTTTTAATTNSQPLRYDDERLQRILRLLDRYTRNLEAIEEHVRGASNSNSNNNNNRTQLQLLHSCELATQTSPNVSKLLQQQQQQQQQQQSQQQQQQQQSQSQSQSHVITLPPCERRYHTITISTNSSAAFVPPAQPQTLLGRIGRTLGDFAGAFCLCLQVNKDCVFCLGFFIAFVISASFLTAFFYRSINIAQPVVRATIDAGDNGAGAGPGAAGAGATAGNNGLVTLPFNGGGGYYYVYNSHRQHFV